MRPHISINVTDVAKTVQFYEKVFGVKPQKQTQDYAKFDLKNPALNFSLQSGSERVISKVNHFGIEVDSQEAVEVWEKDLTKRGVLAEPETGVDCCFAKQDKVWFQDPDGNSWEIFYVIEQLAIQPKISACHMNASGQKCC